MVHLSRPFHGPPGNTDEIDAFVSEELYIHTKCLIADDRVVIVGSANMNDRSQLGNHDSEIAVVIEDPTMIVSQMNGQPFQASRFAASLRRQLFRKHLGLLVSQDCTRPDANFTPVTQDPERIRLGFTRGSHGQRPLVTCLREPLVQHRREEYSDLRESLPSRAHERGTYMGGLPKLLCVSTSCRRRRLRTKDPLPAPYPYGHVFKKNFPEGPQGVKAVKECLAGVRGSLVDMPLEFLADVKDLVKEGLDYNVLTEDIYT